MTRLILASASPRRRQILENLGVEVIVIPPADEEETESFSSSQEYAEKLARHKAWQIASSDHKGTCIVAADTIVVIDEQILGKPLDAQNAFAMLRLLAGRSHKVITGVCVIGPGGQVELLDSETTTVHFCDLSDEEIDCYIASGEPFDKAGGYGIQGLGALLVERIDGCYYNVVGLPVVKLQSMLNEFGINILLGCNNGSKVSLNDQGTPRRNEASREADCAGRGISQ
ncbi:MAG: Maf family protein [Ignavibacteriales bacterium]